MAPPGRETAAAASQDDGCGGPVSTPEGTTVNRSLRSILAGCALALAAAACSAHSTPITGQEKAAAEHIATQVVNACASAGHAKSASTAVAVLTQSPMINALIHHSSRTKVLDCWYKHGIKKGTGHCVLLSVLDAPRDLTSSHGRGLLANAIFTGCLVASGQ